jgi:hypothetical protein
MTEAKLHSPLQEIFLKRVKKRTNCNNDIAQQALAEALDGRPFLDWLRSGGLETLLILVINIIRLLMEDEK